MGARPAPRGMSLLDARRGSILQVLAVFARRFGAGGFGVDGLVPFDPASPWKTFDPTLADEFKRAVGGP